MRNVAILSVLVLLAVFILLPGASNGKYNVSNPVAPLPWPIPPNGGILTADGSPLPWPPKPPSETVLSADGSPLPWPPKPPSEIVLIADGSPLPWPPKPPTKSVLSANG